MIRVVLPAFNEEGAIGPLLDGLHRTLRELGRPFSVLVVNDGSRDGTAARVLERSERFPLELLDRPRNRGLSFTLEQGLRHALTTAADDDIIVTMDADDTHPPELLAPMLALMDQGCDLVVASRFRPGARVVGVSAFRRLTGWGASFIFRLLIPIPGVRDYTCGYRTYRASLLRRAAERFGETWFTETGFSCMADLLLKLRLLSPRCAEVPLLLRYDRKPTASTMRVGSTILHTLRLVVRRRLGRLD